MDLVGLFAGSLFLLMVLGDWRHFTRWTLSSSHYGCPVARAEDTIQNRPLESLAGLFNADGVLPLDHGLARFFPDERRILFAPRTHKSLSRFCTAWPLKSALTLEADGANLRLRCVKLMPWSSALVSLLWFALVGVGTLAFVVKFLLDGGAASLSSLLMGAGIVGVGLLVFVFGLVTVALAYRLEDQRLMLAYQELRAALMRD
jgi:hypothetical protein